jgi:hypothetical protein
MNSAIQQLDETFDAEEQTCMSISFQCPHCGRKLKAPDNAAGKASLCPGCRGKVTCPVPADDADVIEMTPLESGGVDPYRDLGADEHYAVVDPEPAVDSATERRRPCPMCGEMILATAAKCRFCGEVLDPSLKKAKGPSGKAGKKKQLRTIAFYQKYLIRCVLIQIVIYVGSLVLSAAARPLPQGPALAVGLLLLLALLVAGVAGTVFACMLANKIYGVGGAVLFAILSLIPCLGLIALLVVNSKATGLLRERGYTVGFLGAHLSEF